MSSRATYLLPSADNNQQLCFYIHQDGYPAGAAHYFYNMHASKNANGGLAERFFRANAEAQLIHCQEAGTDTEFRYTINHVGILRCFAKDRVNNQWCIFYEDAWHHFVNQHLEVPKHLHVFKLFRNLEHETLLTITEVQRWVSAFMKNGSLADYVREGVESIQVQIDAILEQQKLRSSKGADFKPGVQNIANIKNIQSFPTMVSAVADSPCPLTAVKTWEERFALFSIELEEAVIKWSEQNPVDYSGGYQTRIAKLEKCVNEFYQFFNQSVNEWVESSGILKDLTTEFDLLKVVNQLRDHLIEKFGFKLSDAIQTTRIEYGYDIDHDQMFERGD